MKRIERLLQLMLGASLGTACFAGIIDLSSENTEATIVSGIVYDGSGGPWTASGSPYIVVDDISVPAGQTLTIEPSVQVKFDGYHRMDVDGTLYAVGTEAKRITFTSNSVTPEYNDWDRIQINSDGIVEFRYGNVSYSDYGIYLYSASRNNVSDTDFFFNNGNGIFLDLASNNTIAGNRITIGSRIYLWKSTYNNIIDNYVTNTWSGIYLVGSSYNNISANIVSNNQYGIEFDTFGSALCNVNNTISNNTISNNGAYGLALERSSYNNTISNNTISNNGEEGLHISGSSNNNTVQSNTISDNWYGISVHLSSGNSIHHNNIIDNLQQAGDDRDDNQWDDGYPSGGNYWSDYTGIDNKSGPNQNEPDSDGIGDIPHVIDADSEDKYPLMARVGASSPRPPQLVQTNLDGANSENVRIIWLLSPDDGAGLDSVVGYRLFRNTTFDSQGRGYQLIASLPNGTSEYTDHLSGEGDPNNYFYQLCAADDLNNRGCSENQAAKFTRTLPPGPNLVSVPLIQSSGSIEAVLQTVRYDKAWFYDSSSQEWIWFMKDKEYRRGLWNVDHTQGMWVNVKEDSNFTVAGVVPTQTVIHLYAGWNLVSFPSFDTSFSALDLRAETGGTRVEGFDQAASPNFLRVLEDAEALLAGEAYWVRVDDDSDWIVEVS